MKLWLAPSGFHIELGKVSHANILAKLHAKAFYRGWSVAEFESLLADPARTPVFIALDKRKSIVGFAILRLAGEEAELLSIVVSKAKRKKGIGAAILQAMIDDLFNSPVENFLLEVDEDNVGAIKLYKNFGFKKLAERKGYYTSANAEKSTALVMALKLD